MSKEKYDKENIRSIKDGIQYVISYKFTDSQIVQC